MGGGTQAEASRKCTGHLSTTSRLWCVGLSLRVVTRKTGVRLGVVQCRAVEAVQASAEKHKARAP